MCTAMVDIPQNNAGIVRPQDYNAIHRNVQVKLKNGNYANSRGGIDVNSFLRFFHVRGTTAEYFTLSFLQACPPRYKELDMSIAKESCINLR